MIDEHKDLLRMKGDELRVELDAAERELQEARSKAEAAKQAMSHAAVWVELVSNEIEKRQRMSTLIRTDFAPILMDLPTTRLLNELESCGAINEAKRCAGRPVDASPAGAGGIDSVEIPGAPKRRRRGKR